MDERENLPAKLAVQGLSALAEKRGSLVARGMAAVLANHLQVLAKDNDARYRQAREVYNRLTSDGLDSWYEHREQEVSLTDIFRQLANEGYGKAYLPLSVLYRGAPFVGISDHQQADRFEQLAFDWLHTNQHLNDPEIWHDLGALYVGNNVELAIHWFHKAADAGDASSMWELSGVYEHLENWHEALYWQTKAAQAGHEAAQHGLEMQHEHGDLESRIDEEQVFDWYVWSAEQGLLWAQLFLANAYRCGCLVEHDDEQSAHWYLQAATQGEPHAQLQLGKMLWEGRLDVSGVEPNDAHARHWLEKAAEHGDPESKYELGMFLFERAEHDEEEHAVQSIQSAATQGYGPAQYLIASDAGTTFDVTDEQCQSLFDGAFSWYEEHAEWGDTELRLDYALMHLDNWNSHYNKAYRADRFLGMDLLRKAASEPILIDDETGRPWANSVQGRASRRLGIELLKCSPSADEIAEAIHWLEQAADLGNASACEDLASLYACGHPGVIHRLEPRSKLVEVAFEKADYWCGRAIDLGQTRAVFHLGRKFLEGEHLPQNLVLAEKWLLQAANAGNGFAQMLLGVEYESGKHFAKNIGLAKHWYKNPAKEGRWLAAHNLARLLEIDSSFDEAILLYKKAAYGGYKPSQQRLDELGINWKTT